MTTSYSTIAKYLCLATVLAFSGTTVAAESELRRATSSEPSTLDPHLALGNSSSVIIDDLFVGLMTTGADGKIAYGLASSHEVSESGLLYTFYLRENALWSDGTPITAEDVLYSLRRLMDPATAARYAGNLYFIKNAEAVNTGAAPVESLGVAMVDTRTVTIELERPVPYLLKVLAGNALTIVPRQAIESHGLSWSRPGKIVVNGAYNLVRWVANTEFVLKKNETFWAADEVAIDQVKYLPTDDVGTGLKRFRAGELDIILGFPPEQYSFLKKAYGDQINISSNLGLFYWVFNTEKAPFDKVEVRKALSLAIDREGIAEKLKSGLVDAAWGIVPPESEGYSPPEFDNAKRSFSDRQALARELLAEAGFSRQKPLRVELRYDSKEDVRQIAVAVSAMWRQIGVEAELSASDFRAITSDIRKGDFDIIRYQWYAPYDDPTTFLNLVKGGSRTNYSKIDYAPYNELLSEAAMVRDPQERLRKLEEAEALIMTQHPVIPIYYSKAIRMVSDRVSGWKNVTDGNIKSRYLSVSN